MDTTINKFLITIVAFIYDGIGTLYEIFLRLAKANLFNDSDNVLSGFIRRLYVIIGVVMLFFLAYSLLRTIVNPNAKDKNSIGKIIGNVVKAIVIIAIVPAAFDLAFEIQESIMKKNTIGKIILGVSNTGDVEGAQYLAEGETVSDVVNNAGVDLSTTIFSAFFYPYISEEALNDSKYKLCENETKISVEECQMNNFQYGKYKYIELSDEVKKNGNFSVYKNFADVVNNESEDEYIVFNWVFALIAGGFCLWIMITYTLSLALRIIKLAYYEIIAPIPAIADIVPGQQGMFKKWLKAAAGTFIEALVRVAILFFCVYIIRIICSVWSSNNDFFAGAGPVTKKLLQALLIMGVITFMSKAPELISEIFGGNGGKYGFGLKDFKEKLAAGGFFMAAGASMAGGAGLIKKTAGAVSYGRKRYNELKDTGDNKWYKTAGLIARGAGSVIGGTLASMYRGGSAASGAKDFSQLSSGIKKANAKTDNVISGRYTTLEENPNFWGKDGRLVSGIKYKRDQFVSFASGGDARFQVQIDNANELLNLEKNARSGANSAMAKFKLVGDMGIRTGNDILDSSGNVIGQEILDKKGKKIGEYKDGVYTLDINLKEWGNFKNAAAAKYYLESGGLSTKISLAEYEAELSTMTKTDFTEFADSIKKEDFLGSEAYKQELERQFLEVERTYTKGTIEYTNAMEDVLNAINKKYESAYEMAKNKAIDEARRNYSARKVALQDMIAQIQKETENQLIDNANDLTKLKNIFGAEFDQKQFDELAATRTALERISSKISSMGGRVSGRKNGATKDSVASATSSIKDIKEAAEALRDSYEKLADEAKRREAAQKARKGDK